MDATRDSRSSDAEALTPEEREAINSGRWFASLSATARHDLLRLARVKRYDAGDVISERGSGSCEWYACASGTVRIGSTSVNGKQVLLAYVQPGIWFGDPGLFDDGNCTHDAHAHEATTLLAIPRAQFQPLLATCPELCVAILRLQARHIRDLYDGIEEANTLPLRPRLAKRLVSLARSHGVAAEGRKGGTRIGLHLAQQELAQLVGYSRQRVNAELKNMERTGLIRVERIGLIVCNTDALRAAAVMHERSGC